MNMNSFVEFLKQTVSFLWYMHNKQVIKMMVNKVKYIKTVDN